MTAFGFVFRLKKNGSRDYNDKVHWALLFHKMHVKGGCLLKAYKAHNPGILWQCGTDAGENQTQYLKIISWIR